jgi:hypothetical protein
MESVIELGGHDTRQPGVPGHGILGPRLLARLSRPHGRLGGAPACNALIALNGDYAAAIDDGRLEDWPSFFTEDCFYRITNAAEP